MTATSYGKGSAQRPIEDRKKFNDNWDAIFGAKSKPEETIPPSNKQQDEQKEKPNG